MTLLSKDAILAAQDLQHEDVAVPEWGGAVRVRMLTGAERDAWEGSLATPEMFAAVKAKGPGALSENARARLVAFCCVDEAGQLLFAAEDMAALGAKSAVALDRVFAAALRVNALGEKDITELGKAFAAMLGGASSSSSPNG